MDVSALFNAMPGAIAQGLIWGIMAIGVYITFGFWTSPICPSMERCVPAQPYVLC